MTTKYLILLSLAQGVLVSSQYVPPQAYPGTYPINTRTHNTNHTLFARGDESDSKELWLMSHDDFCIYGLPNQSQNEGKRISESMEGVVSYCSKSGHNTRLIPDGTLRGVTYVRTPSWVQVSGSGDFTKIGLSQDDAGGQFDSSLHSPEGARLTTSEGDDPAQDWVTMISAETFCVRACFGDPAYCPTQYDSLGCYFLTSNGVGWDDVWQDCEGDDGSPPGVIDVQTYTPGNGPVPTPSIPAVSYCQPGSSISNGHTAAPGSEGASSESKNGSQESTTWIPVQTCLPCTGTADPPSSASASASSSAPREGGAKGGGEPSQASSAASSAFGSDNPFADESDDSTSSSESAETSQSAGATPVGGESKDISASAPASTSASDDTDKAGETEQVGVTKLSSATATSAEGGSITAAPSQVQSQGGGDLKARVFQGWWGDKRQEEGAAAAAGEGGIITSADQCCFTTWTPSVAGGSGAAAKETGISSKGSANSISVNTGKSGSNSTGTAKSAANKTTAGGLAPGPTGSSSVSAGISGSNNRTAGGVNGTTGNGSGNGTNSSASALLALNLIAIGAGGTIDKLVGLSFGAVLGLILGGVTLV
ncbi:uncharacterized protein I303_107042 [Kwoniella dejecticola CBS 10117]|uniref:Immunoreactive mannoprotein MP88 n=1 Tax=Kwoniella dejecticola CBS 10117 TaxID=1296121 RepID=A0A1A5ZYJ5_9TREE|nr:uncharacterized protein I303_06443 [Kwoniella dejecticola CBS 10117]OBR82886.1 hypothetical protein I303_06443 [Kwoniella dejecticola CBS 10117]